MGTIEPVKVRSRIMVCALVGFAIVGSLPQSAWGAGAKDVKHKYSRAGGKRIWEFTVTAGAVDVWDFHICIGEDAVNTAAIIAPDVDFRVKPDEFWATSVTKDADNQVYLNWFLDPALLNGNPIPAKTKSNKFKVAIKDARAKNGTATFIFTSDGDDNPATGAIGLPVAGKKKKGPVLSDAGGRCILPDGACTNATEAACSILGGVFDPLFDCANGACCVPGGCDDEVSDLDCQADGFGIYFGDGTVCGAIECPFVCPEDVNNDLVINVIDLIDVLLCFGLPDTPPCDTGQDVNGDGTVNVLDLIDLLLAFGTACPQPPQPFNDACLNRVPIFDGLTPFDTTGATTDGPAHATCQFDGQTYNDIWYNFTANCTGTLTVSTCNEDGGDAFYDTDLVVYDGCACPVGDAILLGCSDDAAGCTATGTFFPSRVQVPVLAGNCYKIRAGGFSAGSGGLGFLSISAGCP